MTSRSQFWDVSKGVAILLVILGHSLLAVKGTENRLLMVIFSFHVPLFFVISGFFFYRTLRHNTIEIIFRKFFQLLVPVFLVGSTVFSLQFLDKNLPFADNFKNYIAVLLRTLWFLQALFTSSILILLIHRLFNNRIFEIIVCFLLIVVFLILPDYLNLQGTKIMFPFFLTGFLLSSSAFSFDNLSTAFKRWIIIVGICLWSILLVGYRWEMTKYDHPFCIFNDQLSPMKTLYYDAYCILIGIVGSLVVLSLIHVLCHISRPNIVKSFLAYLGQRTLWLYITSTYIFSLSLQFKIVPDYHSYAFAFLISIAYLIISLPIASVATSLWNRMDRKLIQHLR